MSCEFVCQLLDKKHLSSDAERDRKLHRQYDPLDVWPLGHHAAADHMGCETSFRIRVTGPLTRDQGQRFCARDVRASEEFGDVVMRQRLYTFRVSAMPQAHQDAIRERGVTEFKWKDLKPFLFNKRLKTNEA